MNLDVYHDQIIDPQKATMVKIW